MDTYQHFDNCAAIEEELKERRTFSLVEKLRDAWIFYEIETGRDGGTKLIVIKNQFFGMLKSDNAFFFFLMHSLMRILKH